MRASRIEKGFDPGDRGAIAEGGMVASAFPDATAAGVEALEAGGNAADAACAVGLALGVCEPQASGIGGQSIGVLHMDGRTVTIDGSSRAPSLAVKESFGYGERRNGYRATTVPSTVATYAWLSRTYGKLPWSEVVAPAARVAREGYRISELQSRLQARELGRFQKVSTRSGADYFLKDGQRPYEPGDLFRQTDLANVLETLAQKGAEEFYTGDIAAQVDADMRANDGFIRYEDLALIPWPIEREVLKRRYRGVTLATIPPPGAGRILLLVMMMLGSMPSDFVAGESPERMHFLAETFRKAFLRRLDRPFGPSAYGQVRDKKLLSREHARELALSIRDSIDPSLPAVDVADIDDEGEEDNDVLMMPGGAPSDLFGMDGAPLRGETTHFSVMDSEGGAVSMTQSIEMVYGSKAAAGGLGFLYNDYMLAFELDDPANPYYLRPNAVPWSTAAPTIAFRKGVPWLALGSPGSERIFSSLAQVLSHMIDESRPLDQAISAPRLHCSTGGRLSMESGRFMPGAAEHLEGQGYKVDERDDYAFYLGCVQAVLRSHRGTGFQGYADPRRDGCAGGPR